MTVRRQLLDLLAEQPRSAWSIARELGIRRQDVEEELGHAIPSAKAAGHDIDVRPARCKACDLRLRPGPAAQAGTMSQVQREPDRRSDDPGG